MSLLRQDSHNEDLKSNGDWHFYAMLIEVALFIAILGFQLNHIKSSLDNKLVLWRLCSFTHLIKLKSSFNSDFLEIKRSCSNTILSNLSVQVSLGFFSKQRLSELTVGILLACVWVGLANYNIDGANRLKNWVYVELLRKHKFYDESL